MASLTKNCWTMVDINGVTDMVVIVSLTKSQENCGALHSSAIALPRSPLLWLAVHLDWRWTTEGWAYIEQALSNGWPKTQRAELACTFLLSPPHHPPPILPTCPLLALKSSDRDHTISDMTRRFLLLKAICQTCWNNICRMNCKQCVFFLNIAEIHDIFYHVILSYCFTKILRGRNEWGTTSLGTSWLDE